MRRRVGWSRDALDDFGEVLDFFAASDSDYALRLVDQIHGEGNRLGDHPTGRPGRVPRTFEKPLPKLKYILAYSLERDGPEEVIYILRVIHMARNWPAGTWPD